jgi:hypothetical protein
VTARRLPGRRQANDQAGTPRVELVLPLEGIPIVYVLANTFEDELRLRSWLRRSPVLGQALAALDGLLDELDDIDREAAA